MKKKIKNRTYLYFSILACFIAIITTALIGYMALLQTKNDKNYPSYGYNELVDQTENKQFKEALPGQLYEAESLEISKDCTIEENYSASRKEVVSSFVKGCSILLEVTSDTSTKAMLSIATNFISPSGKNIRADSLIKVYVNSTLESTNGIIRSNFNRFDFSLDDLLVVHLLPGLNRIEIESEGDYFDIDYITLKGKEKHLSKNSIETPLLSFKQEESRQYYQPDDAILKGPLIIKDEKETTDGYSAYFSNPYDTMEFDIGSDEETDTTASFLGRLQKNNVQPNLEITLNGNVISFDGTLNVEYGECSLGSLHLKKGINQIFIRSDAGSFYFSSLILNSDITHSPSKYNERYEAEDAIRKKGPVIVRSDNASKDYAVGENNPESYLDFRITSKKEDEVLVSITLSYILSDQKSNLIFETSLNREVLDTSCCLIKNTTGYDYYSSFLLGTIHLRKGENILRIYSFSGGYNVDCITLIRKKKQDVYPAKDLIQEGMQEKHVLPSSDGYVLEARSNSFFLLQCYYDTEQQIELSFTYSLPLSDELGLSSWMEVHLNGNKVPFQDKNLKSSGKTTIFRKETVGRITLRKGLNEIRIQNITTGINFETIVLKK